MKKIWIISELFYPNDSATAYILTEIAKKFTQQYEVNVICADTNYEHDINRVSDINNKDIPKINIFRVNVPELNKNNLAKRLLRVITVSRKLYRIAKEKVQNDDLVFAVTNPAFLLPYMAKLKAQKKVKYILLVHDVFPENAKVSGIIRMGFPYKILKRYFDKAYSAADKIIVLGEDMKEIITIKTGRSDNVFVCENWGDENIVPKTRSYDGKIVLQYAGNIGRVQGLEDLLSIANKIKSPLLMLDFWGSGALAPYLNGFVNKNHLTNVRIRGSYNRKTQQNDVLNDCDIAIVGLAKGMKGLGVPSKAYNILAAGKPILYIGDPGSEIYNLVKTHDLGAVFEWDEQHALTEWLNGLTIENIAKIREKGKRSRDLYEKQYTKKIILEKMLGLLDS